MRKGATVALANFDSATGMLRALASFLHGRDFPMLGVLPKWTAPLALPVGAAINRLPRAMQEQLFIRSGASEAVPADALHRVRTERIAAWMTGLYPVRKYPAVMIGSSNGALVHLCAALGIPWLPQTVLVPVRRSGVDPDEPAQDLAWARPYASRFLAANPDVRLHHMCDPNQDRLMIQKMSYFRYKYLRLPLSYRHFLQQVLEPGGRIIVVDCGAAWPTRRQGERHVFQFGAAGGATQDEYLHGGKRVEDYLSRYHSSRRRWDPPVPDGTSPEAEWGFDAELGEDITRYAQEHGCRVQRLAFAEPEHVSPLVADLYLWWNRLRGIQARRLLVDSFILMEPFQTIRTGAVPSWTLFNVEPSAQALERYLDTQPPFDDIDIMLFSNGIESVGQAPAARWEALARRATSGGRLIGTDSKAYPRDFAVFIRYYFDLLKKMPARHPMPASLTLAQLQAFLREQDGRYAVAWR